MLRFSSKISYSKFLKGSRTTTVPQLNLLRSSRLEEVDVMCPTRYWAPNSALSTAGKNISDVLFLLYLCCATFAVNLVNLNS